MFTPIGGKSRTTKTTRRSKLSATDQPAVPLSGPPSYSYGSSTSTFARTPLLSETRRSIATAFNEADSQADARQDQNTGKSTDMSLAQRLTGNMSSERTPKKRAPSLEEIEASVNRRRSLRNGSRSVASVTESRQSDIFPEEFQPQDVSLSYEVTQSTNDRTYEDDVEDEDGVVEIPEDEFPESEEDEDEDEERPSKVTQSDVNAYDFKEFNSGSDAMEKNTSSRSTMNMYETLGFFRFLFIRMLKWPIDAIRSAMPQCYKLFKRLKNWLLLALSLLGIIYVLTQLPHGNIVTWWEGSRPSYKVPSNLPSNSEELVSRLHHVEKALGAQSTLTESLSKQLTEVNKNYMESKADIKQTQKVVQVHVSNLKEMTEDIKRMSSAITKLDYDEKRFEQVLADMRARAETLGNDLEMYRGKVDKYFETGLQKHDLTELRNEVATHENAISDLRMQMKKFSESQQLKQKVLHLLEENLPKQLGAVFDADTGRLRTHSGFWENLKKSFVAEQKSSNLSHTAPDWDLFMQLNGAHLNDLIASQSQLSLADAVEQGVLVSRSHFMQILRGEIESSMGDYEARLSALQNSLDLQSESAGSSGKPAQAQGKNASRDLSEVALEQLIKSALHKHSLDVLARPDYAAYLSGARVNPFLTSATYIHQPAALLPRLFSKVFFYIGSIRGHPPAMAIHQSSEVGMCWAFPGSRGQLSVKLSQPIYLTDIAVEHVHPDIAHDATTAPKDFEIWAQVADEHVAILSAAESKEKFSSVPRQAPGDSFVHVMDFTYNLYNGEQAVQSFAVPSALKALNIPVRQIVYRIKTNWGNSEYTCVYRVRAIGISSSGQLDKAIDLDEDLN